MHARCPLLWKCPFLVKSCSFLARLSYTCKILARSCTCKESGYKCLFSCTILQLAGYVYFLSVFSHHCQDSSTEIIDSCSQEQKEHPNFVQVKGHKYLSFFHFHKIKPGKSVKQANKFELPYTESVEEKNMMKKGKKWRRKENEKKSVAGWIWTRHRCVVRIASEPLSEA